MREFSKIAPYNVLIVDDAENKSDFGPTTKNTLELLGCNADWVKTRLEAIKKIESKYYDVLIIDIDLGDGKYKDGFTLQKRIRDSGKVHPIIIVTGQNDQLQRPIKDFKHVFASGPTFFFEKGTGDIIQIFEEAVKHIDPVRRAIYLLKFTELKDTPIVYGEKEYSIDELLIDKNDNEELIRQLRDAFYEFFIQLWKNDDL